MNAVLNRTDRPLRVPLAGGKVLHLAPRARALVAATGAHGPAFHRMVHEGLIALEVEPQHTEHLHGGGHGPHGATHGHPQRVVVYPAGNRGGEPVRSPGSREA